VPVAFATTGLAEAVASWRVPVQRLNIHSTDRGEFWETLSYSALGLCGLAGIVSCFV
jgi:hypothetical protein